jgi:signal transduction histidine kinase
MVVDIRRGFHLTLPTKDSWILTATGLVVGFIVFALVDACAPLLMRSAEASGLSALHFVQGFLSCASGMGLATYIVSRKDHAIQKHEMTEAALLAERQDFLAVINHRLRNALLANDRIMKLMLDGDFGQVESTQKSVLEAVGENNKEVDRLIRMLVDIYEYRNGTKQLQLRMQNIDQLLQEVIEEHERFRSDKRITIRAVLHADELIRADRSAIHQLVEHIIENALKHARGEVVISTHSEPGCIRVSITDDGVGIPDEDQSTLFDRFFVQSHDGSYAAVTGIGLCLCSLIAKAHGGKLSCESQAGVGTTFTLELPIVA